MGLDLNNRKNSTYIFIGVGILFIVILLFTQLANSPSQYAQELSQEREQKDLFFKNSLDSPIPQGNRENFEGLNYFPIQDEYRVEATLVPAREPDTLNLLRTRGVGTKEDRVVKVGKLRFELKGKTYELIAFSYLDPSIGSYFVPFRDRTTGEETYGGGRYLEVPVKTPLVVDFNRAYNPDCVFNKESSCPLPPRENVLDLEVRAGELDFMYPSENNATP